MCERWEDRWAQAVQSWPGLRSGLRTILLLSSPSLDTLGTQADYKPGHKTSISTPIFGNCEVKVLYQVNLEVKICGKVLKAFQRWKLFDSSVGGMSEWDILRGSFSGAVFTSFGESRRCERRRGESEKPMGRRGVGELLSFPFFLATMWISVHLYFVGVHLYLHVYILNCFCILLLKALSSLEPS